MDTKTESSNLNDTQMLREVLDRIASDLSMIIDREIQVLEASTERVQKRVCGEDAIHLSFKLEFKKEGETGNGCILIPLPEAVAIASYLMMAPDETVQANREANSLDRGLKDAMLEVANFIGGSTDAVLRSWNVKQEVAVSSEGCQGVKAGDIPNFKHDGAAELILGRVQMQVHEFPPFELILMFPSFVAPSA